MQQAQGHAQCTGSGYTSNLCSHFMNHFRTSLCVHTTLEKPIAFQEYWLVQDQGSFFWLENMEGEPVVGGWLQIHQPQVFPPYFAARKKNPVQDPLHSRSIGWSGTHSILWTLVGSPLQKLVNGPQHFF
jgi:hypothetical protein